MPVAFNKIPANLRLPGVFIETDPSKASRSDDPGRILVVGQMLAGGTAAAGIPVPVTSVADAKAQFGVGSMLASMIDAVRLADPFGLLWALPLADAGGAVAASGTITVTAAPTAPGVIPLYIARRVSPGRRGRHRDHHVDGRGDRRRDQRQYRSAGDRRPGHRRGHAHRSQQGHAGQ